MADWSGLLNVGLAGGAAGLGVAVPLGAVGVLLLEEGRRGRRVAASAATAVALVDLCYAALAVTVGPRVAAALAHWEVWTRTVSAALLAVIAVRGLLSLRRPPASVPTSGSAPVPTPTPTPTPAPAPTPASASTPVSTPASAAGSTGTAVTSGVAVAVGAARRAGTGTGTGGAGAAGAFVRFLGLTLVNPTTALYFVALAAAPGGPGGGAAAGAVYAGGVFLASLTWQQLLATLGVFAGSRLTGRTARRLTYGTGYGLVAYYAVRLGWPR
jgi:arginine exporter protein ArgO